MDYDRLGKTEPNASKSEPIPNEHDDATSLTTTITTKRRYRIKLLLVFALAFLVASAVSVAVIIGIRAADSSGSHGIRKPTVAISRTCSRTLYPALCVNSLLDFPGATSATEHDLVHISVNMTLRRIGHALFTSTDINNLDMDGHVRSAYEDCLDLLGGSVDHLDQSLTVIADGNARPTGSAQDVVTWLSAAMTNQDTCAEGLGEVSGSVKEQMEEKMKDLSELVSNSLAIYSAAASGDEEFVGIPIQNRRRLMSSAEEGHRFPTWLRRRERALLEMPVAEVQADIVVAKDGSGTYTSIKEAIKKAPEKSDRRTIIYVKAGK